MFKKQQGIQYIQLTTKSGQKRKFIKVKFLGAGGFARCYQVYQETNTSSLQQQFEQSQYKHKPQLKHFAFKIIKKSTLHQSPQLINRLKIQIRLHKKFIFHEQIVNFIQSFQNKQYIYLLLQLCPNQTLNELLRRRKYLTEQQTRYFIYQLALGLKEIHSKFIIHRDIKLCNLFIGNNMQLKIGDFGLANQIVNCQRRFTICGTANYMAPEIIGKVNSIDMSNYNNNSNNNTSLHGHSYEVDIWSLGVVCYSIFYGKYPFQDQHQDNIYHKIINCKYNFPFHSNPNQEVSSEFKSFIQEIFQVDYKKRINLNGILKHNFLMKTELPKELPLALLKHSMRKDILDGLFKERMINLCQQVQEVQTITQIKSKNALIIEPQQQATQTSEEIQQVTQKQTYIQIISNKQSQQQPNINNPQQQLIQIPKQNQQNQQNQQNLQLQQILPSELNLDQDNKQKRTIKVRYFVFQYKYLLFVHMAGKHNTEGVIIKVYNFKDESHHNEFVKRIKNKNGETINELYSLIIHPKMSYVCLLKKVNNGLRQMKENLPNNDSNDKKGKISNKKYDVTKIQLTMNPQSNSNLYHQEMSICRQVYLKICH